MVVVMVGSCDWPELPCARTSGGIAASTASTTPRTIGFTGSLVFVQGTLWVAGDEVATASGVLKILESR